jgi:nucleotide-binding universal stress UspA family protein
MKNSKIKNILVPIDFSPISINALKFAAAFCKKIKASLHLINVVELSPMVYTQQMLAASYVNEQKLAQTKAELTKVSMDIKAEYGINVRKNIYTGPVYDGIIRAAHLVDTDLIIIGTAGNNSISDTIFGSTTTRLLRNTTLPVLTLAHNYTSSHIFDKIVLPINNDKNTLKKVDYLSQFTQLFGKQLLIYAYSSNSENEPLKKQAQKIAKQFTKSNIEVSIHEAFGDDYALGVISFAKKENADLITTICHNDHSIFHFFSTNEQNNIVNESAIPVLNIPIFGDL